MNSVSEPLGSVSRESQSTLRSSPAPALAAEKEEVLVDAPAMAGESEEQLRTIIDTIPGLVWGTGPDGAAEYINKRWLDYTGLSPAAAKGWGWSVAIHPDDLATLSARWLEIIASQRAGEVEARLRRFDGEFHWFLFRAAPLLDRNGNVSKWYGTNTDIEDLKRAEDELRRSEQVARGQVEALVKSLDVLATAPVPDQFITRMLITMARILDAQWAALFMLDEQRDAIILRAAIKGEGPDPTYQNLPLVKEPRSWRDDLSLRELFSTGVPVICEDLDNDTRSSQAIREYFKSQGTKKFMRLPTLVGGEVKGFVAIRHGERPPYQPWEIELAQALAHQTMLAMQTGESATLEERNRMAREIHDTLAQGFSGVVLQLEAAEDAIASGNREESDAHVRRAGELARWGLTEARRSVKALRPRALEKDHFWDAFTKAVKNTTFGTAVRVTFETNGDLEELPVNWEDNLLRIGQEALTNALKHADADTFATRLELGAGELRLEFRDNGKGFQVGGPHDGFGLTGMAERVEQMGGRLEVTSTPGSGTRVTVTLPWEERPTV